MDHIFSLLCLSGTFQMPDIGAFTLLGAGYFLIPVGDLELGSGMQSIGPSGSSCQVCQVDRSSAYSRASYPPLLRKDHLQSSTQRPASPKALESGSEEPFPAPCVCWAPLPLNLSGRFLSGLGQIPHVRELISAKPDAGVGPCRHLVFSLSSLTLCPYGRTGFVSRSLHSTSTAHARHQVPPELCLPARWPGNCLQAEGCGLAFFV